MPSWTSRDTSELSDQEYQDYSLLGVSRTFALTIPQLPEKLRMQVGNAYLLCRITDTIEDVASLTIDEKQKLASQFVEVVKGNTSSEAFVAEFSKLLTDSVTQAEQDLIKNSDRVVRLTQGFAQSQRNAIEQCVKEMAFGMIKFQKQQSLNGLRDIQEMGEYCYYVAGVVGVMLTELFCDYSTQMKEHKAQLLKLAVSFGQGLQMTNILKDIWEDRSRGACWLPQDIFSECNFDLSDIADHKNDACYLLGMEKLISIARHHLQNALEYTLMIPAREKGIRRFCFWAIGMALLTLRKINARKNFDSGQDVKISRRSVKLTILLTELIVGGNKTARWMFRLLDKSLPHR